MNNDVVYMVVSENCCVTLCEKYMIYLTGMLHAGIGPTHVNALFPAMNIPPVSSGTLNLRREEVGPLVEEVERESCQRMMDREQEFMSEEGRGLTVSYDMAWSKRGRAHNSLTGNNFLLIHSFVSNSSSGSHP